MATWVAYIDNKKRETKSKVWRNKKYSLPTEKCDAPNPWQNDVQNYENICKRKISIIFSTSLRSAYTTTTTTQKKMNIEFHLRHSELGMPKCTDTMYKHCLLNELRRWLIALLGISSKLFKTIPRYYCQLNRFSSCPRGIRWRQRP